LTRRSRTTGQSSNGTTASRFFDFLNACDAVKLALIALLDAKLANVLCAAVIGLVFTPFNLFFFFLIDLDFVHH
jgi:hypothetical protein